MLSRANILPWHSREKIAVAERVGSLARIRHMETLPVRRSLQDAARDDAPQPDALPRPIQPRLPIDLPPAA